MASGFDLKWAFHAMSMQCVPMQPPGLLLRVARAWTTGTLAEPACFWGRQALRLALSCWGWQALSVPQARGEEKKKAQMGNRRERETGAVLGQGEVQGPWGGRKIPEDPGDAPTVGRVPVTSECPPLHTHLPPTLGSREILRPAESGGHLARPVSPAHANNCS